MLMTQLRLFEVGALGIGNPHQLHVEPPGTALLRSRTDTAQQLGSGTPSGSHSCQGLWTTVRCEGWAHTEACWELKLSRQSPLR